MTISDWYKARIAPRLRGLLKVVKVIMQNKRGVLGIAILAFFIFIAVGAPLLTPYDPLLIPKQMTASSLALPSWVTYLPGYGNLSQNVSPIDDPSLSTNTSLQQWEFTTNTSTQYISLAYSSSEGSPDSGPGSIAMSLRRSDLVNKENAEADLL